MLGVRISWQTDAELAGQVLYRDDQLLSYLPGDVRTYEDAGGTDASIYRVQGRDLSDALRFDSGPFQSVVNRAADLQARTRVDHDFPTSDANRFVDVNGGGIGGLTIRVYKEADWLAGRRELAIYVIETKENGRWNAPVFLEPGLNYVLHVGKNGYGPILVTLTV